MINTAEIMYKVTVKYKRQVVWQNHKKNKKIYNNIEITWTLKYYYIIDKKKYDDIEFYIFIWIITWSQNPIDYFKCLYNLYVYYHNV